MTVFTNYFVDNFSMLLGICSSFSIGFGMFYIFRCVLEKKKAEKEKILYKDIDYQTALFQLNEEFPTPDNKRIPLIEILFPVNDESFSFNFLVALTWILSPFFLLIMAFLFLHVTAIFM